MRFERHHLHIKTQGRNDLIDITEDVVSFVKRSDIKNGFGIVFVIGSTASIITMEYEPGLIKDVRDLLEKIIPQNYDYKHNATWDDDNGHSHLRATLLGQSFTFPIEEGRALLGTWQQIVLAEFDHRPRERTIVLHIYGP